MTSLSSKSSSTSNARRGEPTVLPVGSRRHRALPRSRPPMPLVRDPRRSWRWGIIALVVVLSMGGAYFGGKLWQRYSAASVTAQLDDAPVEGLDRLLAKTRVLGAVGRRALVGALIHERDEVRAAAQRQITAELDSWRTLEPSRSSQNVAELAELLVEVLPQTPSTIRRYSASLATELLVWPVDNQAIDATLLVHHCEQLLQAGFDSAPLESVRRRDVADQNRSVTSTDAANLSSLNEALDSVAVPDVDPIKVEPENQTSVSSNDVSRQVEMEQGLGADAAGALNGAANPRADETAGVIATDVAHEGREPTRFVPSGPGSPLDLEPSVNRLGVAPVIDDPQVGPPPINNPLTAQRIATLSHLELLKLLHVSDSVDQAEALSELHRRGFRDEMIELGKRLTDADPQTRLAAVQGLRTRPRFDPVPWLMVAARDDDPEVRRLALVELTAGSDPFQARWAQRRLEELGEAGRTIR